MLFIEPSFLFLFLPVLLAVYFPVGRRCRNAALLIASLLFYAAGEKAFVLILVASVAMNYLFGVWIDRMRGRGAARIYLAAGIAGNLSLLAGFKYFNFFVDNLNVMFGWAGLPQVVALPVHMPIGISFFTFQAMTYIIDVYRGEADAQKNPVSLALYIALFPQLIAGPIVRYRHIAAQLAERTVNRAGFAEGVRRFVIGLGKKRIIADTLAVPADSIFALPAGDLTTGVAWFGALCYTLQIYFDFSGYSDMAIGLGRMFGFRFPENFNYPYIARSITEFWRRWHISLSTWFRDYLYIPLGGNRRGAARLYFNLVTVFILCGFWHGAEWKFVLWGVYHGVFLVAERAGLRRLLERSPAPVAHVYAALAFVFGWVLFRADNAGHAAGYAAAMLGFAGGDGVVAHLGLYGGTDIWLAFVAAIIGSAPVFPWLGRICERIAGRLDAAAARGFESAVSIVRVVSIIAVLLLSMMLIASGTYNPFLYFRF
ncbi:MAG TPA: MBOAT family protein [bacterium]|nr:MBOAT family protein [bacterium]